MTKFIHTTCAGSSSWIAEGTVLGVGQTSQKLETSDLDHYCFVEAQVGMAKVPDDSTIVIGSILGTPLSAGTGNSDFADQSAIESGMIFPPTPNVFFNGTTWAKVDGTPAGLVTGVSIVNPGTDYSTADNVATLAYSEDSSGTGLTIHVTSVNGNGGVTGVSVGVIDGGGYAIGDLVSISAASGNAILEVTSVEVTPIGTINSGRGAGLGPNDMSPSYFSKLPLDLTAEEIYLIIPGTGVRINYDASLEAPYTHDSFANAFNGTDFTVEIHCDSLGKFAETTCLNVNPNVDRDFCRFPYTNIIPMAGF